MGNLSISDLMTVLLYLTMIIVTIGSIVILVFTLRRCHKIDIKLDQHKIVYDDIKIDYYIRTLSYSKDVLDLIKTVVNQIAVLKYKEFKDTYEVEKINITRLKNLSESVAETANNAIDRTNILFDVSCLSGNFFDDYIISTSISAVKELHNQSIYNETSLS